MVTITDVQFGWEADEHLLALIFPPGVQDAIFIVDNPFSFIFKNVLGEDWQLYDAPGLAGIKVSPIDCPSTDQDCRLR